MFLLHMTLFFRRKGNEEFLRTTLVNVPEHVEVAAGSAVCQAWPPKELAWRPRAVGSSWHGLGSAGRGQGITCWLRAAPHARPLLSLPVGLVSIRALLLRVLPVSRLSLGSRSVSEIPLYGNSPSCWSFYTRVC